MPSRIAQYQMVPTATLEEQQRADAAAAWAQKQRAAVAADWAAMHEQDAQDSLGPLVQASQEPAGGLSSVGSADSLSPSMEGAYSPNQAPFGAAGADSYLPPPDTTPSPLDVGAERYAGPAVTQPLAPVVPPAPVPEAPWQPPRQVGYGDVGQPSVADNLPLTPPAALKAGGQALNDRIEQANTEFGQSMAANSRALDTGSTEDIGRAFELAEPYTLAMTGEPVKAVTTAGRAALGATNAAQRVARMAPEELRRVLDTTGESPLRTDFFYHSAPDYAGGDLAPSGRGGQVWLNSDAPVQRPGSVGLAIDKSKLDPKLIDTAPNGYPVYRGDIPADAITVLGRIDHGGTYDGVSLHDAFRRAAGTDSAGQAGMSLGPVSPHEPDPSDFAAWMQWRKDQAAGKPKGPTSRQPMGMRAYEQHARRIDDPMARGPVEPGPAMAPPEGGVLEAQRGMPMSGDDAIARTDKMFADAASHAGTPLKQRLGALGTSLVRATTDAGVDLTNLERDAARTVGRPLNAKESASIQSRLNPFYTARIRVDEGLRPTINDLSEADYNAVRNILTWKGNVDDAVAKGNAGRAFSGDISAADSQAALDTLAQRLGPERFGELERRAYAVTDFNVDELERDVAAGLVSRTQADQWLQQYPNYTPTVIADYLKEQGRAIGGKSLNVQGTGYKTKSVEGTTRARLDPIAASIDAAYQGEALRRQNTAWRALHDMVQAHPEMQNLFQVKKGGYTGATKYENSVTGYIDGEQYTITTPFPDVAKAIRQEAGGVNFPGWNTAMALYKELITGRNPTFLVGNAAVDAPLAVLTTAMREGGAHKILPIAVDLFKGYADAFKGVMSGEYGGTATRAYLKGGGGMGFYAAPSATTGAKEVQRLRRGSVLEVNSAADAARIAKDLVTLEWVKGLGERVELGPRAMAYNRALKRGLSPDEAIIDGRTVTVDFAQGGTVAKLINSFVPFFNPAVQGVAQAGKVVAQHPRGALMTLGPALVGPSLAAEAWNRADPERSKAYDDVPDYVKDRGIVIMLPGAPPVDAKGEPHPQFVAINLRQYAPIATMTREVYDRAAGRNGRTALDLLQGAAQQISPVQDASGLLPPFATTAAELAANRDLYRRSDIATERNDQRASALSQAVAPAVGARPSQVDFALRDTTGALGEMATGASNIIAGRPTGGAPQDVPVAGGFVRRLVRGDTGQQLQDARDERLRPEVQRALGAAGLKPDVSVVSSAVRSVPLTRAEQTDYQRRANGYVNETLGAILADPGFADLPLEARQKVIQRVVEGAKQRAGAEVLGAIGDGIGDRVRKKAG